MKKLFCILVSCLVFTGCTSLQQIPLDSAGAASLKGQSITHTTRKMPLFVIMGMDIKTTHGEGPALIKDNQIPDPADAIARELVAALSRAHGARPDGAVLPLDTDEVDAISVAAGASVRFVVDVQTFNWLAWYFPFDWTHYRLLYSARARVIDVASRKVIAEGFCNRVPDDPQGAPSYKELVGDGAAGLKKEISLASDACLAAMKETMLGK